MNALRDLPKAIPAAFDAVDSRARSLLIGKDCFAALKAVQQVAPGPRLDLRYWVEGAVAAVQADAFRGPWIEHSRAAFFAAIPESIASIAGTGQARKVAPEGATATAATRTQGASSCAKGISVDCRSLHVGAGTFGLLKSVQDTTQAPRVEIRHLVEGAWRLLIGSPELHEAWVIEARQALARHLVDLANVSFKQPFLLEIRK